MSYQAQTWVDEVGVEMCRNGGEAFVLVRIANHTGPDMRGCFASAATLARLCKMGRSTVLKHIRELLTRRLILPGDPALTDHLPADKRPPVYDLAGGHEPDCEGSHSVAHRCTRVAGVQSDHPCRTHSAAGARSEHPPQKRRSPGVRSQHPKPSPSRAGVQNEHKRVLKTSTNSSKELKLSLLVPARDPNRLSPQNSQPSRQVTERENSSAPTGLSAQASQVPEQAGAETAMDGRSAEVGRVVAQALATSWREQHGTQPARRQLKDIATAAGEALADGDGIEWLLRAVVPFMVAQRYLDLGRAKTHPACPAPRRRPEVGRPTRCPAGKCDGSGIVYRDPDLELGPSRCDCRARKRLSGPEVCGVRLPAETAPAAASSLEGNH